MPRTSPDRLNEPFRRAAPAERRCQVVGCDEPGTYRAPVSRDRLREYYWFCLAHVRAYNRAWDYFVGMNETEIEVQRRMDTVWQRPSWPLGQFGQHAGDGQPRVHDGFGFFAHGEAEAHAAAGAPTRRASSEEQKALAVLDLSEPATFEEVRARYMALVKKLHPDANGRDSNAEERLKVVNLAYAALKTSFA